MQKQKNEEYINKILEFKKSLDEKIKNELEESINANTEAIQKPEILNIIYYSRFTFKTKIKDLLLNAKEIYIVEIGGDKPTCEIYIKDATHKIAEIDMEGKIAFFDDKLDENTTLSEMIADNSDKEIDEMKELNKEELEELEKKSIDKNSENVPKDSNKEIEEIKDTSKKTEKIEKELGLIKGDIRYCNKIKLTGKDNLFVDKVKESKEYDEVMLAYVQSEDCFRLVGLKKGQPATFFKTLEPSTKTLEKSDNIDARNGNIEQQNIKGLMKFTDSEDYDFSVRVVQYGDMELDMSRKDPVTGKRISTRVETEPNIPNVSKENQKEVNTMLNKNKNTRITEEVQEIKKERNENGPNANININNISDKGREEKEENERTLDENVRKYYE